ncbi:MAG: hypothetical protein ACLSFW_06940 [Bacteroides cellulosilyticus]
MTASEYGYNQRAELQVNWLKVLPMALAAVLYTATAWLNSSTPPIVREKKRGRAAQLKDMYLRSGKASYPEKTRAGREFAPVVSSPAVDAKIQSEVYQPKSLFTKLECVGDLP